jgi:hypothetical protein
MKIKFAHIMFLLALVVAGCSGYFSVLGLSKLFSASSLSVIIMASALEVGKVVTTTALHRYWKKIGNALKIYLTISVGVLMLITSAGIYGFLSNAYQQTANKLDLQESQVGVLDSKKLIFEKNLQSNEKIVENKTKRIDQLVDLRNNQELRLDKSTNNRAKDKARGDIKLANEEIQKLSKEIDEINIKNSVLSDSINAYTVRVIELSANSEVSAEIGPLKYISELTNTPMSKVVNLLILLLIFVFDPLAIAMVLMANRIFELDESSSEPSVKKKDFSEDKEPILEEETIETPKNIIEDANINIVSSDESIKKDREPVIPNGKIQLEDIREIKNRGFSVDVPNPKSSNNIERIGANKVVKDGDNNKVYYRKN